MKSKGRVHHLILNLNPNYTARPCFWTRLPEFEEADTEAYAFIVSSVLKFKPRTLDLIFKQMSPLAFGILLWSAAEMKRACGYSLNLKAIEGASTNERQQLARYADDGCPLVDDNR
jgi:hypothetical protein